MRIRIVDAFTDRPFAGNPAGVVLLESWPAEEWLRRVAAEVNLSETAFAVPLTGRDDADFALRWLTPATEVDLCGHATLATAHVLYTTGTAAGRVRFATRSGVVTTEQGAGGVITLDFPAAPLSPVAPPPGLAGRLGAEPLGVYDTGPGLGDLLVELADEATVAGLDPRPDPSEKIIVTAPAAARDSGYDFVSRCFFPGVGIAEDPVTGSAHTALGPFWAERTGRGRLTGRQISARGGTVAVEVRGDRTLLSGTAVTVIEGELLAGPDQAVGSQST
ncbi:PhzF family phenazine biosynthesis protein [Streptomyces sp. NPDC059853]|uniref:PhzF family phenazine biosynthesis protein n=1 Tax=Streptomyces sp. NPDC059853 TaxID=3346973 RepID=UPI00365BF73E